ncbi:MAG: PQQ-binding-like beta-propeller repeat protein [Bacteroidota bacterium]|nr:PQQ-binding-like beta-propeller repeat protein [Bacteroidota bacterium]
MKTKLHVIYQMFFICITLFFSSIIIASDNNPFGMFRCDPNHSGIYPSEEIVIKPDIKWKFKTEGIITSSAAINNDKIYFGSGDNNLYCLNLRTGSEIWSYKTGGEVFSSPLLFKGNVYFGSYDGNFYALDEDDGKVNWIFTTAGEKRFSAPGIHGAEPKDSVFQDSFDLLLSSPTIEDNKIYFTTGSVYCYALDASTGKEIWKFKTSNVAHTSPAVSYGNVYFGSWDTYLYAVNAMTGKEVWKFKTGDDTDIYNQTGLTSSPVISDGILYTGCRDSYIYAIDAYIGKEIWKRYNGSGWVTVTPVFMKTVLCMLRAIQNFLLL